MSVYGVGNSGHVHSCVHKFTRQGLHTFDDFFDDCMFRMSLNKIQIADRNRERFS